MYELTLVIQVMLFSTFAWAACTILRGMRRGRIEKSATGDPSRFAIIVCAHNEAQVVGKLLQSLENQRYDRNLFHVFLVADHCGDQTAAIGERFSKVTVWRRNEGPRTGKGAVLRWGISRLVAQYGNRFSHLIIFDADNVASPDFLTWMDKSFRQGETLVMGNRRPLNPYDTLLTRWYSLYWICVDVFLCQPNANLGRPAIISGTGFGFSLDLLDHGQWPTQTMVEDMEFSMQQNFKGIFATYQEKALFYDEQPENLSTLVRQFRRWFTGHFQIARIYWKPWIRHFLHTPDARLIDNFVPTLLCVTFGFYLLISVGWVLYNAISGQALFHLKDILWWGMLYLLSLGIASWATQLGHLSFKKMWPGIATGGLYCILLSLIAVYSLFFPQRQWVPIAHTYNGLPDNLK